MSVAQKMILYNLFPLLAGPSGSLYSIADYFRFHPVLTDPDSRRTAEEQVRDAVRDAVPRENRVETREKWKISQEKVSLQPKTV